MADAPPSRRSSPDIHARVDDLEILVGTSPSRALGSDGSGLIASVEGLHAAVARLDGAVTGIRADVDRLGAAVLELSGDVRSLTAEIRRAGPSRPPPSARQRAAVIVGVATLVTALSSGIAAVVSAGRGTTPANAAEAGR